jgi:hypothetical protein
VTLAEAESPIMRHAIPAVLVTALLLAGCGEEQTAQSPTPPASDPQEAPAQATRPQVTQPAQPPAPNPAVPGAPAGPADQRNTGSLAAAPPPDGRRDAAFQDLLGRSLTAGSVTLRLEPDNRFVFRDESGRSVTGRYAFTEGVLTMQDAQGDVGQARFPMSCRFEPVTAATFRFQDVAGSCSQLSGVAFTAGNREP